ncbi:MAG: hypothetical protein VXB01_17160, partial [Opitutae bacterium]
EYNKVIPRADGEAAKSIATSEGYSQRRVNEAKGDALAFDAIFKAYSEVPEVTRKRIYLETMEQVLQNAGRKIILDDEVSGVLPLLNLNQEGK